MKLWRIIKIISLSILVIGNSGYMLQVTEGNFSDLFPKLTLIVGLYYFLLFLMHYKSNLKLNERKSFLLLFITCSLISSLVNISSMLMFFNIFAVMFIAYELTERYDSQKIIYVFNTTMMVVSIISLIFIAYIKLVGTPNTSSIIITPSGTPVYNFIVFFYHKLWDYSFVRNMGIFWEAGLFASYLTISLLLEICFYKKTNKLRVAIFAITLITTLSTAGLILLLLVSIIYINEKVEKSKFKIVIMAILFIITFLLAVNINNILNMLAQYKPEIFLKLVNEDISLTTRTNAPYLNLKIFLNNPVFGAGFSGANQQYIALMDQYGANSQTSTSTYFLAAMGITGIIYTIAWTKFILNIKAKNIFTKILLLIVVIFILNKEPHATLLGTWIFMFLIPKYNQEYNLPLQK